ncbi:MAG: tRNA (adenosine(37)-N6)-dimethylallyltransferase MiaA [candidate division KSB1 bacterium]|nr:tRNA (adenosine(37)-N6)-dimethylallyltransferase MiaA [candidate division KSB1 bacterium]MDZ7319094.1 tRNA (adenosine(37)-N6)-dimethylallyltransferase MiaA [candidate division KSB1 bacterium]MDZ7340113.1 tRNA (adenosine(37)-N6)-dimethylallyltransferase MiaA [candidate division KSB1 bacterium]
MKPRILILVGPTGVGKTALSLQIAMELHDVEIISADSRQVYKLMDIGTAKPTPEQRAMVPHHFIDIKYPNEYYSAGQFGREARRKIDELQLQGKRPLVVGGSGLYIQALVDGFFEKEIFDPQVKARLKNLIAEAGLAVLYEKLERVDPNYAQKIHPNDGHRIVRALEVYELTGEPFSTFQEQKRLPADFEPILVGLTMERTQLYQRIDARVEHMLAQGLIDEVHRLQQQGYGSQLNSLQTVGYREVFDYLDQKIGYDEMVSWIKQHSRNYAKRQMTWFRKDCRIKWFELSAMDSCDRCQEEIVSEILRIWSIPD